MFIRKLSVTSFKAINDLELTFYSPTIRYFKNINLTVIVGENGAGKSSVLQLLTQIFCPAARIQYKNTMEKSHFSVEYELDGDIYNFSGLNEYPSIYPSRLIVSSYAVFDQFSERYPIGRQPLKIDNTNQTEYVYCGPAIARTSTLEPLIYAILNAFYLPSNMDKNINSYNKLFRKIGYRGEAFFEMNLDKNVMENISKDYRGIYQVSSDYTPPALEELLDLLNEMRSLGRKTKQKIDISSFNNVGYIIHPSDFEGILGDTLQDIIRQGIYIGIKNIWLERADGKYVRLSDLSSGELTMLFRFLPLIANIDDNSIVLIDEPETHLHPAWIQEFVEFLVEIFDDYKAHFILASHSPLIASDVPKECILGLLTKNSNYEQFAPNERTFGGSSNDILREVFGLKNTAGLFTLKKIDEIDTLLSSNESEKIQIARAMFNDLSATVEKFELYKKYIMILGD